VVVFGLADRECVQVGSETDVGSVPDVDPETGSGRSKAMGDASVVESGADERRGLTLVMGALGMAMELASELNCQRCDLAHQAGDPPEIGHAARLPIIDRSASRTLCALSW
jgi:hypothetical protein